MAATPTTTTTLSSTSNYLTYDNSTLGIRFEYPADCKYYLSFVSNSTASVDEVQFNLLITSLKVSVRDLHFILQNVSIQQLTNIMRVFFNGTGPYFSKVLSSENATLSAYPGQKIVIAYNYPSQPKSIQMTVFIIKNGVVYSILFASHATYYNTFLPTAQKIIDSFKITK